jgi:hypothetical protein
MTKMTKQQEQDAKNIQYIQEHGFHEDNLAQPLYDTVEFMKGRMTGYAMKYAKVNPSLAAAEILDVMSKALLELDAVQQKYFPDDDDQAA